MRFSAETSGLTVEVDEHGSVYVVGLRNDHVDDALKRVERLRLDVVATHEAAMKASPSYAKATLIRALRANRHEWERLAHGKVRGTDEEIAAAMATWKATEQAYVAAGGVL